MSDKEFIILVSCERRIRVRAPSKEAVLEFVREANLDCGLTASLLEKYDGSRDGCVELLGADDLTTVWAEDQPLYDLIDGRLVPAKEEK